MALDPRLRFGLKLIEIRKTRGWSQERLALESGLARSYLGGVERGQRNIALLNIFKLAEALGVEPSVLTAVDSRTNPASTAGTAQHDLDLVSG